MVIDGAPWRARTQRATPIAEGDSIRVMALEGLVLTVEPADDGEGADGDGGGDGLGDGDTAG